MAGKLYIVPTPVGNLGDITPRAVEILKSADLILAEDTRTSGILLKHFGIETPMKSFHKFNENQKAELMAQLINSGKTIALISDAGTPGISDPGFTLARQCRQLDIPVSTLPGATAVIPALVNSGLPCDRFVFEGFLPARKGRSTRIAQLADDERTFVLYESPLRLTDTLHELAEYCGGEREAAVCREISKVHEETARGTLSSLHMHFYQNNPKGECVIVIAGRPTKKKIHKNKYKIDEQ